MNLSTLHDLPTSRPAREYPGAVHCPLQYPGIRPTYSYFYVDGRVLPIRTSSSGSIQMGAGFGSRSLKQILKQLHAPPADQRYAVLAVGSNACPGRLEEKFPEGGPDSAMPVLLGTIRDVDTLYLNWLADYGALPATCALSEGNELTIWLNLFSEHQLEVVNRSETMGEGYKLVRLPQPFRWEEWEIGPVYAYHSSSILEIDSTPVRLDCFPATSTLPAMNQSEILTLALNAVRFKPRANIEERHAALVARSSTRDRVSTQIQSQLHRDGSALTPGEVVEPEQMELATWRPSIQRGKS